VAVMASSPVTGSLRRVCRSDLSLRSSTPVSEGGSGKERSGTKSGGCGEKLQLRRLTMCSGGSGSKNLLTFSARSVA